MDNTVLKKTGSKVVLLTISKIITLLLSVVTAMILSRGFDLNNYGTYSEILTVSSLAVSIFSIGIPSSLNYFLPQKSGEEKIKFLSFYYLVVTLISCLIFIVIFFSKGLIVEYYGNENLNLYGFALLILPWTKMIISSRSNMLVAEGKLKKEFIYCILNSIALLFVAALSIVYKNNMKLYMLAYVATEIVFSLLVYFEAFIISEKKIKFNINKEDIKTLLVFSVPLGLSTAISTISLDLDKLIIGFFSNEIDVAIYANAGKELPFSIIATSFTAVILPQIVLLVKNQKMGLALQKWKSQMQLCFIALTFFAAASIVFAPQIITILYSEQYLAGVAIFRIYSFTLIFRITYWGMLLNAYGKTRYIFYNSIICIVFNIAISILLYYLIGFNGPALGSLLGVGLMSVLNIINTRRVTGLKFKEIVPIKGFLVPLFVCAGTALISYLLVRLNGLGTSISDIVFCCLIGLLWMVIYFVALIKPIKRYWNLMNSSEDVN